MSRLSNFISVAFILCSFTILRSDQYGPPMEFSVASNDDQFIFVCVAPKDPKAGELWVRKPELERYPVTGLYQNNGSTKPLWQFDADNVSEIWVPSDGIHLIALGPWPYDLQTFSDVALIFFERDKAIKSYSVKELVRHPENLPRSISHYEWLKRHVLSDSVGKLWVETLNKEKYVFEIATGKMLSKP